MSKTLLSRIKPFNHQNNKPTNFESSSPFKILINNLINILHTSTQNQEWEQTLEITLSEHDILVSDIAHLIFDKLRHPEPALKLLDWISRRPYGCSLNGHAYSSLLKLLAKHRVFSEIELVLKSMKCDGISPSREAVSVVITVYSNSGIVDKALELYYFVGKLKICVPDVFACNALLNVLVKNRKLDVARKIYDEMIERSVDGIECADNYSTCIVVRSLCKEGKVKEGRKLIEDRWGEGCVPNIVFYNTLIDGYCRIADVRSATGVFKELKSKGFLPTVETYGAIINGFSKVGNFDEIGRFLKEMNERGLTVNVKIYNSIIDAQHKHLCSVKAEETIRKMIESGCDPDIVTYNTLINVACQEGEMQAAEQLLEQAINRSLIPNKLSYTPLIHGYSRASELIKASDFLIKMTERGCIPDLVTYGALVHGLVLVGEVDNALKIRDRMIVKGLFPDARIYNVLMSGLCKKGKLSAAKDLFAEMLDYKISPDGYVYATLVDGFIRNGKLEEAKKLFDLTLEKGVNPGVVGYNTMIKGYCKFGMIKEAVLCINLMKKRRLSPDEVTYSTIIDGYVKQNDLDGALVMLTEMEKQKYKPNVVTYTSLINGFCRRGDSNEAEQIFSKMQHCGVKPNVVTYSILIGQFGKKGKLVRAATFFECMLRNNCVPNDVTFHYLVNGFIRNASNALPKEENHSREQEKSIFMDSFGKMISDGWDPITATYNSILICLCQNRMLKSALQLRDKMVSKGFLLDYVSFAALLHGICLEGQSNEWKNIITCHLKEKDLQIALKFSLFLDEYTPHGSTSEASLILQTLVEDNREVKSLKFSARILGSWVENMIIKGRRVFSWTCVINSAIQVSEISIILSLTGKSGARLPEWTKGAIIAISLRTFKWEEKGYINSLLMMHWRPSSPTEGETMR